ncbi:MAG: hypothetical protein R3A46_12490 [Thermomicrobiales bacterium]
MEFLIGTEMRDEYLSFEVAHAARKMVEEVMPVKAGENVVISADTSSDGRVVQATAEAVYALGAHPVVIWYETRPDAQMEPPGPVAAALKAADVWFEFGVQYILYTDARREATEAGCRHACYGGMDVEMLVRTIGRVDQDAMGELGRRLRELCMAGEVVRITDTNGTDLTCPIDKNPPSYLGGSRQDGGGYSQMLGGQSGFSAKIDEVNGVMVFDGALWPPAEIGPLKEPVKLTVENGYVTSIEGGPEAPIFERWMAHLATGRCTASPTSHLVSIPESSASVVVSSRMSESSVVWTSASGHRTLERPVTPTASFCVRR